MSWFRLKACPKCHGDLASDDGDWLCLQCGTYYYTGLYSYSRLNRSNRPVSGPEAGCEPLGQLSSATEPGQTEPGQSEPGSRDVPDYPPQRQEKSLVWALRVSPAMAGAATGLDASTANSLPSVNLRSVGLAMHYQ